MELVIGTHNQGKLREYRKLLADAPLDIVGLDDIGLNKLDVEETGDTFETNAALKAHTYARASGRLALADDSGLEVDALDGAPGVYSARYGGDGLDDAGRRQKLLADLVDVADEARTARFVCVIAVADPRSNDVLTVRGTVEGKIIHEERDKGRGFGYDPVFMPDGYDETFGELDSEVKNSISHRGVAAKLLLPELKKLLQNG